LLFLFSHIKVAFETFVANKLRTFLSLLGITIGVFCIISVLTLFDSLRRNISANMQTLGSNVLYVGKFAWIPEDEGEYPWWKYKARPVCKLSELEAIKRKIPYVSYAALSFSDESSEIEYRNKSIKGIKVYAVTYDFNKLQNIDILYGRYFSVNEMEYNPNNTVVIGYEVAKNLFTNIESAVGKSIKLLGRKYNVAGIMSKQGQTITGFHFDNSVIVPYRYVASYKNIDGYMGSGFTDPLIMIKSRTENEFTEMKYEVKSVLRAARKIRPGEQDNFAFNQLSLIQNSIDSIFVNFNLFGWLIGFFSLLVGAFGIANIMFVSVKERTNQIGIKKAIGAKSGTILAEFLIEAILLCILGGLLGMLFVVILSYFLTDLVGFSVTLSLSHFLLGVLISIVVGVIAGYTPASRASKLHPVVAIRS
jgi:ABC-type antimicrobial peptide transport system, permease component